MGDSSTRRYVLFTNLVMFAMAASLAWLYGGAVSLTGAVVGAIAGLLNLSAMAWLVGKLVASGGGQHTAVYGMLLTLKMGAILGVLAFVVLVLDIEVIGLTIGISSVVLSLIVGALLANIANGVTDESSDSVQD